ncbi:MAG: hypothetical protein PHW76_07190 [Alphaproteobacteria bacterium]|nr:hypothetical protein [Alphaproteobacteria bacterium]
MISFNLINICNSELSEKQADGLATDLAAVVDTYFKVRGDAVNITVAQRRGSAGYPAHTL